jgi:hypothetical protein
VGTLAFVAAGQAPEPGDPLQAAFDDVAVPTGARLTYASPLTVIGVHSPSIRSNNASVRAVKQSYTSPWNRRSSPWSTRPTCATLRTTTAWTSPRGFASPHRVISGRSMPVPPES